MELQFPYSLKEVAFGGLLPSTIVFVVAVIVLHKRCSDAVSSAIVNAAIAIAVLVGTRLVSLPGWKPVSHWHWLPWCGLFAAVLSPLLVRWGWKSRVLTTAVIAIGTSILIVPSWDDLPLSWSWLIVIATLAVAATGLFVQPLSARVDRRVFSCALAVSAFSTAAVLTCAGSLRLALIGVCISATFIGLLLAQLLVRRSDAKIDVSCLFAVLIVGMMVVRRLNTETGLPFVCFVLPLIAPLMLWEFENDEATQMPTKFRLWCQIGLPAGCAFAAIGIAMAAMFGAASDGY